MYVNKYTRCSLLVVDGDNFHRILKLMKKNFIFFFFTFKLKVLFYLKLFKQFYHKIWKIFMMYPKYINCYNTFFLLRPLNERSYNNKYKYLNSL